MLGGIERTASDPDDALDAALGLEQRNQAEAERPGRSGDSD
jgi:hypothetical protein